MDAEQVGLMIGAITIILAIFSLVNSFLVAFFERQNERRTRVADLYNEYYSAQNYRCIALPVVKIALKWSALPEPERAEYRKAIRQGWLLAETDKGQLMDAFISPGKGGRDPVRSHFEAIQKSDSFSEHESLTVFLYFWVSVHEMMNTGVIDRKMTRRLLKISYDYHRSFIAEFRADVKKHAKPGSEPIWVEATQELERFFS